MRGSDVDMKRANFDLATAASGESDLRTAKRVLRDNGHLLQRPGVIGVWVGARFSEQYIMVAINQERIARLSMAIPDSIDGVKVYFVEGKAALH